MQTIFTKSMKAFIAIDMSDLERAYSFCKSISHFEIGFKLGMEFFYACGFDGVQKIASLGNKIFLDLKLHDIPNTVKSGILSICKNLPNIDFLTIHAQGGSDMISAAKSACPQNTKLLAVTILTSLAAQKEEVLNLAVLSQKAGADGIVCSGLEAEFIRKSGQISKNFLIVTPGIRINSGTDDQKRVVLPKQAFLNGADYIVIGRPITQAENPVVACENLLKEII